MFSYSKYTDLSTVFQGFKCNLSIGLPKINVYLSYFLDNDIATYLAKQKPIDDFARNMKVSDIDYLKIKDQEKFGETGDYFLSYTFIEFLDTKYGWKAVVDLISGKLSYQGIFSKGEECIYQGWKDYVEEYYT